MQDFYSKLLLFRTSAQDLNISLFQKEAILLYLQLMGQSSILSAQDNKRVSAFILEVPSNQEDLFHQIWFFNALARYKCFVIKEYDQAIEITRELLKKSSGLFQAKFESEDKEKKSLIFILALNHARLFYYQGAIHEAKLALRELKTFFTQKKGIDWLFIPADSRAVLMAHGTDLIKDFTKEDVDYFLTKIKALETKIQKKSNLLSSFNFYCEKKGAQEVFRDCDRSESFSWSQVNRIANKMAKSLDELQLTKDKQINVLVCTKQNIFFPASILAAWKCRHIPIMVHENYTEHELLEIKKLLTTETVVFLDSSLEEKTIQTYRQQFDVIVLLNESEMREGCEWKSELPEHDELALGLFTSGTSGPPKLCLFSHEALFESARIELENEPIFSQGKIANLRPHYTSAGLNSLWPSLYAGGSCLFSELVRKRPIERFLNEFLAGQRPHLLILSPTYILALFNAATEELKTSVTTPLYFGGTSLPPAIIQRLISSGFLPSMRYGMTEIGHIISKVDYGKEGTNVEKGNVGKPFNNFQISCKGGLLKVTSPGLATLIKEVSQTTTITPENGYETLDQAFLTKDGEIHLLGRDHEALVVNGFRFNSSQVEEVLMMSPDVSDARVFVNEGVLVAFVLAKKEKSDSLEHSLRLLAENHLSSFKRPQKVIILKNWPMKSNGKIDFKALLDLVPKN